jgi:hypothetical protein
VQEDEVRQILRDVAPTTQDKERQSMCIRIMPKRILHCPASYLQAGVHYGGSSRVLLSDRVRKEADVAGSMKGWQIDEIVWSIFFACHSGTTRNCQGRFVPLIGFFQEVQYV